MTVSKIVATIPAAGGLNEVTQMYAPGDLVFCTSKGFISRAIRLAERLRFRRGARFNHVAVLYKSFPSPDGVRPGGWYVIQAEARGVTCTRTLAEVAPGGSYIVKHLQAAPPSTYSAGLAVEFARDQVGRKYGFVTIVSVLVTLLSPNFVNVLMPDTWICSALAAEALRCGGWLHNWPDIYQVSPAALYEALS